MKRTILIASAALACASPAAATGFPHLKSVIASVDGEYLSFSAGFGSRRVVNAQSRFGLGDAKLSLSVSQGQRKAGAEQSSASRISTTLVNDWTSRFSTRTSLGISGDKPVFVTREAAQDVSFKVLPETVLTAGARYARYYGGTDAWSWSAGASQYFKGGMIAYRFTSYDIEHLGHSVGHLGSFKLNDRGGSSQLWVGHGTSIHDAEFLPVPQRGTYTSAELKRSQKLTPDIALNVGLRRSWYDTPEANYHGTGIHLGLTFGFQPRSTPIDEARNPSEGRSQSGSR